MDSSFFYKLPKDVLVSLLMKTYDKKFIYQLQKELEHVISEDKKRLRKILDQDFNLGHTFVNHRDMGCIYVYDGDSPHNLIFTIQLKDSNIYIYKGIFRYSFHTSELLKFIDTLDEVFLQNHREKEEDRKLIISKIILFIQTYYEFICPLEPLIFLNDEQINK